MSVERMPAVGDRWVFRRWQGLGLSYDGAVEVLDLEDGPDATTTFVRFRFEASGAEDRTTLVAFGLNYAFDVAAGSIDLDVDSVGPGHPRPDATVAEPVYLGHDPAGDPAGDTVVAVSIDADGAIHQLDLVDTTATDTTPEGQED